MEFSGAQTFHSRRYGLPVLRINRPIFLIRTNDGSRKILLLSHVRQCMQDDCTATFETRQNHP